MRSRIACVGAGVDAADRSTGDDMRRHASISERCEHTSLVCAACAATAQHHTDASGECIPAWRWRGRIVRERLPGPVTLAFTLELCNMRVGWLGIHAVEGYRTRRPQRSRIHDGIKQHLPQSHRDNTRKNISYWQPTP